MARLASSVDMEVDQSRFEPWDALVDELAAGGRGVVMTLGKGGVGKTTLAARIATELALRGLPVTLTTTDPAAHVSAAVGERPTGLHVTRIDPQQVLEDYRAQVLATAGR